MGELTGLIRTEQVRALVRNGPISTLTGLAAAFVLASVLYADSPVNPPLALSLTPWLAAVAAIAALNIYASYLYKHARPEESAPGNWASRYVLLALAEGLTGA